MKRIPDVLTPEEREALLRQPNKRYFTGLRNYILMRLMLDCGLRLSEALNLQWADLNLMTGQLKVRRGKGSKDRILWVPEETLEWLRRWKERQTEALKGPVELVITRYDGKPLGARYVQQMVARYARKAGIPKRVHPHTLRHTFATDLLRETKNVRLVQKALGHANLNTTQIYTHIVDEELEQALRRFRAHTPGAPGPDRATVQR
jgi:integrase/recombinase XerD